LRREFCDMGAARFGGTPVGKEGDTAFKPAAFCPNKTNWPALVLEIDVSESLQRPRIDA
jgi:hypothetical protein